MRVGEIERNTSETQVRVRINLDSVGAVEISTGIGFFDHMLTQVGVHGAFDLFLKAVGDLDVDPHHTVEDGGLVLGEAFSQALGDRRGIVRMASVFVSMDDALAHVVLDFSGRSHTVMQTQWAFPMVAGIPTSLIEHFFESFARTARCNLHARVLYGRDNHHISEALFKAFGRALDAATQVDQRRAGEVTSSKGVLE